MVLRVQLKTSAQHCTISKSKPLSRRSCSNSTCALIRACSVSDLIRSISRRIRACSAVSDLIRSISRRIRLQRLSLDLFHLEFKLHSRLFQLHSRMLQLHPPMLQLHPRLLRV